METGCRKIFLSKFPSSNSLKKNNTIIPASNGSVGNERLNDIPGAKSSNCTESGVKKAMASNILSNDTTVAKASNKTTGRIAR